MYVIRVYFLDGYYIHGIKLTIFLFFLVKLGLSAFRVTVSLLCEDSKSN